MKTPEIPNRIRDIRHTGFRNVFEYLDLGQNPFPEPDHPNLWGTETLAGDWSGDLLVVLKDFAPTIHLEGRTDGKALYHHRSDFRTNTNLANLLGFAGRDIQIDGSTAESCGVVYISACFLLKQSDQRSGKLCDEVLKASWPVIDFTIENMPNLTNIVLCGREAFDTFQMNGGLLGDRLAAQNSRKPLTWRKYIVHCTTHTQPTAINTRKHESHPDWSGMQIAEEDWQAIGSLLKAKWAA